jgi:hypothetical protein
LLISTLTDTVAPEQHDVMFAVLGQMEEAHPAYPHWCLPWLGVDPAVQVTGRAQAGSCPPITGMRRQAR